MAGDHVRITLFAGSTFCATIVEKTDSRMTVIVDENNLRMTLPVSDIESIETLSSENLVVAKERTSSLVHEHDGFANDTSSTKGDVTSFNLDYMGGWIRSDNGKMYQFNMTNVRDSATRQFLSENESTAIVGANVSFTPGVYTKADGSIRDIARNVRLIADCEQFTNESESIEGETPDEKDQEAQSNEESSAAPFEIQLIVAKIIAHQFGPEKDTLLSTVGTTLKTEGLSINDLGYDKLSDLLRACSDMLEVVGGGATAAVKVRPEALSKTPQDFMNSDFSELLNDWRRLVDARCGGLPTEKALLSPEDQIEHMKSQGITFGLVDEAAARKYLLEDNNYFRVRSFRRGFKRIEEGDQRGRFTNLDFGMLVDLAEIDDLFRMQMLRLTLDVEQGARLALLEEAQDHENNPYDVVNDFLTSTDGAKTKASLRKKAEKLKDGTLTDPYVKGLMERYSSDRKGYPLWAFLELISFGSLCWFYSYVSRRYDDPRMTQEFYALTVVRLLRNACAHGNCILNDVFGSDHPETRVNYEIMRFVQSIEQIGEGQRNRMLNSQRVYAVIATFYAHGLFVSDKSYESACEDLKKLLQRMRRNKEYYLDNNYSIVYAYRFFEKLVSCVFADRRSEA